MADRGVALDGAEPGLFGASEENVVMALPATLDDWTYAVVGHLLRSHAHEESFDWKAMLPPNSAGKDRFRETAAAMANSGGGFIVIGVHDKTGDGSEVDRIAGIPRDPEFAKHLADILHIPQVDPPVPFELKHPAIELADCGRVVEVVRILGDLSPHAVSGYFPKRTAQGSVPCSLNDVRGMIIRREEQRTKLQLLSDELTLARDAVKAVGVAGTVGKALAMRRIDTRLIAQLHAELQPLFRDRPDISRELSSIRAQCEVYNTNFTPTFETISQRLGGPPRGTQDMNSADLITMYNNLASVGRFSLADRLEDVSQKIASAFGLPPPEFLTDIELRDRGF